MARRSHSIACLLGALVTLAAARAEAAGACAQANCSSGRASGMKVSLKDKLGTEIDSGWMEASGIKVRTRFTINPVGTEPLVVLDMVRGAGIEATWSEKGFVNLKPVTEDRPEAAMNVRFALVPSLEADILGVQVAYNASQLVNKLPGGSFNYDSKATASFLPWGFQAAEVQVPGPALEQSTIFALPFTDFGVGADLVEGTLAIQASTKPTFEFRTKQVRLDGMAVTSEGGVAKIPVTDADALDVQATVAGELTLTGDMDIRPVVRADSVYGYPTFGVTKFSFSAVKKNYDGVPAPVTFQGTTIHIPLPNVKVPDRPIGMGNVEAGKKTTKTVTIDSTGELGGVMRFESSNPQFVVPSGEVKVGSKSKYDLKVEFEPDSDGPASAEITVHTNDPDSPEQVFRVAANGASLDPDDEDGARSGGDFDMESSDALGCAAAPGARSHGYAALVLAIGAAVVRRRRREMKA